MLVALISNALSVFLLYIIIYECGGDKDLGCDIHPGGRTRPGPASFVS